MADEALTDEDALSFLVEHLRDTRRALPQHGIADLDLTQVAQAYISKREQSSGLGSNEIKRRAEELGGPLANAAWQLCRLGVLRPGQRQLFYSAQPSLFVHDFTITDYGRAWLSRPLDDLVFVSPGRSAQLLERYRDRFGDVFLQRGLEAGECYRSQLYLACAAMCGAAREAVLLALAVERMPEDDVDRLYLSMGGRRALENKVLDGMKDHVTHGSFDSRWWVQAPVKTASPDRPRHPSDRDAGGLQCRLSSGIRAVRKDGSIRVSQRHSLMQ